jgi:hypothetical protein
MQANDQCYTKAEGSPASARGIAPRSQSDGRHA